jgi:hypothetical protein
MEDDMRQPDMQKVDALVGRLIGDVGAAVSGALVVLGDDVGLFKAMADGIPVTSLSFPRRPLSRSAIFANGSRRWRQPTI